MPSSYSNSPLSPPLVQRFVSSAIKQNPTSTERTERTNQTDWQRLVQLSFIRCRERTRSSCVLAIPFRLGSESEQVSDRCAWCGLLSIRRNKNTKKKNGCRCDRIVDQLPRHHKRTETKTSPTINTPWLLCFVSGATVIVYLPRPSSPHSAFVHYYSTRVSKNELTHKHTKKT